MKKILSVLLVLCIFVSLFAVSGSVVSAKEFEDYTKDFLSKMSDEKTSFFTVGIHDIYPETIRFVYWIEENNLLPDLSEYTEEYAKKLEADYLQYAADEAEKVKERNQQFFNDNFKVGVDELIYTSNFNGRIIVKACKESILKLEAMENVSVGSPTDNKYSIPNSIEWYERDNYKCPTEEFLDTYELLYALQYYKENVKEDEERVLYKTTGGEYYAYNHLYNHYPEGVSSADEATPDYALVFCGKNWWSFEASGGTFGDRYILQESNVYYPYILGVHIFIPETQTFLTLREAWDMKIDGIEDVFEDYGLGYIRGDSNFDRKINVKDATFLQKCLAGLEEFNRNDYIAGVPEQPVEHSGRYIARVSDMTMDGVVNIKDATAIQKYVAGIPYK